MKTNNLGMDLDFSFDLNIEEFGGIELNLGETIETRFIKPPKTNKAAKFVKVKKAEEFANSFDLEKECRIYAIVDGQFEFFDMIFEMFMKYRFKAKKMSISTLSMSQNNIESLQILLEEGYIDQLDLIVSDYFFSHERHQLIKYMYEVLDCEDRFQLGVASSHTKIITIETEKGSHFVFHGSANLRSSSNIEQICIEENKDVYDFFTETHDQIIDTYKTIDKSVRRSKLWNAITK